MNLRRDRIDTTPATRPADFEGADLGRRISEVRRGMESLSERIDTLARACATDGLDEQLVVTEGPFVGDAAAALETARLWLEKTHRMLGPPAQSLAQAHIAAGGLASRQ